VHRHDQLTGLDGMSIDTMTAVLSNDRPPIPFEEAEQLANLHAINLSYRFDLSMATNYTDRSTTPQEWRQTAAVLRNSNLCTLYVHDDHSTMEHGFAAQNGGVRLTYLVTTSPIRISAPYTLKREFLH
jgi:hypothetical protein